jgi:hypothetical protein
MSWVSGWRFLIRKLALVPGRYRLTIYATLNGSVTDWIKSAAVFDVETGDFYGTGHLPPQGQGMFTLDHRFVLTNSGAKFARAYSTATN